jgi:bacillithiol synthase
VITVKGRIEPGRLPHANPLFARYAGLDDEALRFFTHRPDSLQSAVAARSAVSYPRREVAAALERYGERIGAPAASLANVAVLADPRALCVVTGQQAGFLGGPAYTTYKIVTAIRVAAELATRTSRPVVPVFWLASEDHDFHEINHAFRLDRDGAVRRVSFGWAGAGRPVSDLPMSPEVLRALDRYLAPIASTAAGRDVARLYAVEPGDDYCSWVARSFLRVFGSRGLVVVEPRVIAPLAGPYLGSVFARIEEVRVALRAAAAELTAAGFAPALDPEHAGVPFRFAASGLRERCPPDPSLSAAAAAHPESFSPDAALRPLLQDSLLPTAASVLGPGEIAYQAMLKPLYRLFGVPQPLLLPRLAATLLTEAESATMERCRLGFDELTAPELHVASVLRRAVTPDARELFAEATRRVEGTLSEVEQEIAAWDPNLRITARKARAAAGRTIERLEDRAYRALLSGSAVSAGALRTLRAATFPRASLQERVFPLPFLLERHGPELIDALLELGGPADFGHLLAVAGRH